jgi:hypothetical protein
VYGKPACEGPGGRQTKCDNHDVHPYVLLQSNNVNENFMVSSALWGAGMVRLAVTVPAEVAQGMRFLSLSAVF